ncbi:type VI secretion system protein TssA [Jeongeupia naejangsanensis]|uniref:Type VI secretion system protein TssA n=1 Tax=Jeongeupia naejangsanensis TaxID=613195 RepID=A0ABS2BI10_9NEIS|nr:type VI secretion system protein TssA [Jeongeupia naejangsanensis]MBM3115248.1 type VI secretion system protein TssA [Jeongeupia naejangsanensis]
MDNNHHARLELLLAPISADHPAGEDLGYSSLFDTIREARRADDPSLDLGEWESSRKSAEWGKVRQLCDDALATKSKDLQLAVWLAEALTKTEGFGGTAFSLDLIGGLLSRFWDTLYPELDPDDLDERVGKLEWLNNQLGLALRQVALVSPQHGAYDWYRWQESREVENIGLRDQDARARAIAEGKLAGDVFDKAVNASGAPWFARLVGDIETAQTAYSTLDKQLDERFGYNAPSLAGVRDALAAISDVAKRLLEQCGGTVVAPAATAAAAPPSTAEIAPFVPPTASTPMNAQQAAVNHGPVTTRADAVRQLREVARYFRTNEPHSPVALLAERAAKWAEMPLEEWLKTVIKDDSTLGQLKELLDIRRDD